MGPHVEPPAGFVVEDDGRAIRYRPPVSGRIACVIWLTGWFSVCTTMMIGSFFGPGLEQWLLSAFCVPFWLFGFVVAPLMVWEFWSVTSFSFGLDELVVDRSLRGWCRKRVFRRQEISVVKQARTKYDDDGRGPRLGLVVVAKQSVFVLSRQRLEKSGWLGPVIAEWAGVPFIPYEPQAVVDCEEI
ncbi:MAG: hypothetical protein K2W96_05490 [Gemmataceae bacterium]|nr:hypothetical protein [Gemmataceae bacterium]